MNESARHLLHVEHLVRGVLNAPCCDDEIGGGNNNRALRDKKSPTLNAIVNADVAASGAFGVSNVCDEVFSDVHRFQQFQFRHDCPPALAVHDHDTAGPGVTVNRRGVALVTIDSKALEGRGIPPRASVHVSGATHNHTNSNHAKTIASAIPAAIASIIAALSDMRTLCAFVALRIRSNPKSVRLAVAAVGAVILSARPTLAGADRELLSGQS